MEHEFRPGDVVMFKSGGPKMTVAGVLLTEEPGVQKLLCTWFGSRSDTPYSDAFRAEVLRAYKPSPS